MNDFATELRQLAQEVREERLSAQPSGSEKEQCEGGEALASSRVTDRIERDRIGLVAQLKARGLSHGEISSATGLAPATLVAIVTLPEFRKRLLALLTHDATADLTAYLTGEGINSVVTLAELRDDVNTPKNVRAMCANSLADRAFGKAVQTTEYRNTSKPLPATDAEQEAELKRLETEYSRLKAN